MPGIAWPLCTCLLGNDCGAIVLALMMSSETRKILSWHPLAWHANHLTPKTKQSASQGHPFGQVE